jgi:heme-degrading monooxygenase HmoA
MFVRISRARLEIARLDEYERFIEERSTPMFNAQAGFLGVMYSRRGDEVAVLSFWRDESAVERLEMSRKYQRAVELIEETGFLVGDSTLDVYEVHAAMAIDARAFLRELRSRSTRPGSA